MKYKKDFSKTVDMFDKWWDKKNKRPLLSIIAKRENKENKYPILEFDNNEDIYLNAHKKTNNYLNFLENHEYLCESYPNLSGDIGPGSLAIYLGSKPVFREDTVWYEEILNDEDTVDFKCDFNNKWFKINIELIKDLKKLSKERYIINIPDIIENIDIYSALRGPQNTCFDLMDKPDYVKEKIKEIDETYFCYYDKFYDAVNIDGVSSFTAFNVLSKGRVSKVQCDFSAMMSPQQYREFVVPSMTKQLDSLDRSLYHLDGKDAIIHLDAIMEYDKLDALQWTPGAGYKDGANEVWYPVYDKVKKAGKGLWISVYDGGVDEWIKSTKRIINRYGNEGVYLLYPVMEHGDAMKLMDSINV